MDDTIVLELLDDQHAVETFALINNNRFHLREWLPWVDNMRTIEIFESYISKTKKEKAAGTDYGFVIFFNQQIVGRIGLHQINTENKTGAIGYWLGEKFSGNGIITKCCNSIINFGFTDLHLDCIEIKCATENYKSKAVPERLGFILQGILPQAEFVNDKILDLYVFALRKDDWMNKK